MNSPSLIDPTYLSIQPSETTRQHVDLHVHGSDGIRDVAIHGTRSGERKYAMPVWYAKLKGGERNRS
jgi:hypothetical protein